MDPAGWTLARGSGGSKRATASTELKPHLSKQESIESTTEDVIDEFEENEQEISTTLTHFINATDALDVQNNDGKELLLLNRAEKNLKPLLEYTGDDLPKEAKLLIEKILQYSTELKAKFCRWINAINWSGWK